MLVTKYCLDEQTLVDGMSWVCKLNGGGKISCNILIGKFEEKRAPEVPGISEGKIGPKNDLKI